MADLLKKQIKQFQKHILDWYAINKRNLPWRHTRDPYKILISEVMSQQTQINRVVPKYEAWLKAFPTLQELARAPVRDVLKHWSGLGYNRRALYLKKCAEELVERSTDYSLRSTERRETAVVGSLSTVDSIWPQTEKELIKLPGIGKYTARAILCFAFNKQVAVVDTNVRKVILSQLLKLPLESKEARIKNQELRIKEIETKDSLNSYFIIHDSPLGLTLTEREIEDIAERLLPKGKAYEWNQALMDYANMVLKKEKTLLRPAFVLQRRTSAGKQGFGRAKQSRFKDSDRFVRGQIIKLLLSFHALSTKQLHDTLSGQMDLEKARLLTIVAALMKEGMIEKKRGMLTLP